MEVSNNIQNIYTNYYGDEQLARWRQLSAKDKAKNIIALWSVVAKNEPASIVDIGCGDGAFIRELDKSGFGRSYVGFEISQSAIENAQQHQYIRPVEFKLFDGTKLQLKDKSFDIAVLCHVLEHVESPRQLIREAARVAEYIYVEVPLELNLRTLHNFHKTKTGHINLYNPLLIRHLLQSSELNILAERIICPRREVFTFIRPGLPGIWRYLLKASFLKICPGLACLLGTYNAGFIATSR